MMSTNRVVTFVDGSNLDGALKNLNVRVDDYTSFYRYIFEEAMRVWLQSFANESPLPPSQHTRIYWYVVGKMDEWDFDDPRCGERVKRRFDVQRIKDTYMNEVLHKNPDLPRNQAETIAWNNCFNEVSSWYKQKRASLERKKRFYHGVQASTDFLEVRPEGHWKVDPLHQRIDEKGLDTSLAVDMVALADTYDTALLISGDADGIPGINYVKGKAKHVGIVEFRRGSADPGRGDQGFSRGISSRLKLVSDFVVEIYESDLMREGIAYRSDNSYDRPDSAAYDRAEMYDRNEKETADSEDIPVGSNND